MIEPEEDADESVIDVSPFGYTPTLPEEQRRLWCLEFAGAHAPSHDKILSLAEHLEAYLKDGTVKSIRAVK